jgi:magnesium transporter
MYETCQYCQTTGFNNEKLTPEGISEALKNEANVLWLDIQDIDDNDIDILTKVFDLHPLTIEDFIMANARPKVENFTDYIFLVMFSMESLDRATGKVRTGEMNICLGKNFLITVHDDAVASLSAAKDRVRSQSPIIKRGADFLLYSILDCAVQSYVPIVNDFDNTVDQMSDELFRDPTNGTLKKIYFLKNEIVYLRRTIGPQADAVAVLWRGDSPCIAPSSVAYFRDVYDSLVRLNDVIGISRDIVTGAMEAYVSIVSNRLNEIMKTLTVIATIMMPLTLIASIYGMNFKHMPELDSRIGYPMVISSMVLLSLGMLYYFKRKRWL